MSDGTGKGRASAVSRWMLFKFMVAVWEARAARGTRPRAYDEIKAVMIID